MGKTIIIVDDEPEIIEILRLFLEMEGFSILEARDGKSALNFIQKFKIDLAIIDIMMPNIDGYQLIKMVRKEYKMPIRGSTHILTFLYAKGFSKLNNTI